MLTRLKLGGKEALMTNAIAKQYDCLMCSDRRIQQKVKK